MKTRIDDVKIVLTKPTKLNVRLSQQPEVVRRWPAQRPGAEIVPAKPQKVKIPQ